MCSSPIPGCPEQRPMAGMPCDGGATCAYAINRGCGAGFLGGANAACTCGMWQWQFPIECPNP
jgi:hypothetical protein